jgi:hypothetical protein
MLERGILVLAILVTASMACAGEPPHRKLAAVPFTDVKIAEVKVS